MNALFQTRYHLIQLISNRQPSLGSPGLMYSNLSKSEGHLLRISEVLEMGMVGEPHLRPSKISSTKGGWGHDFRD